MDTRLYVITHKEYTKPDSNLYRSLHVGRAISPDLGYEGDNTGDNISEKNKNYCELTGMYWIWKNISCDIVGICHYRRYFVHDEDFLSKEYIENTLKEYDVIAPNSSSPEYPTNGDHYRSYHKERDLNICREVVSELYPDYIDAFDLFFSSAICSFCNMLITRKEIFDSYCNWLFEILFEVEKRCDISDYDPYQARIYGYLSERLFRIWLFKQNYKIKEEEVRLIDPKDAENASKSVELKYKMTNLILNDLVTIYRSGQTFDMADISPIKADLIDSGAIWLCWWQGIDDAPELVKMCLKSIKKNIPNADSRLHIITLDNVMEYISLPDWIIDKFNSGIITLTHLSDILRANLLYRYGGLWIDATYYLSGPIDSKIFEREFFTIKSETPHYRADITRGRWSGNFMYTKANNILFRFMINAFYMYWASKDDMVDYFLIDYVIALAYDNIPKVSDAIDSVPFSNPQVLSMTDYLCRRYRPNMLYELTKDTSIFKLSYKIPLSLENLAGDKTLYGHLACQ